MEGESFQPWTLPLSTAAHCRPTRLRACAPRSTVLAVTGKDFSIVAGDTRMSTGFSIKSRSVTKIYKMCVQGAAPRMH